MKAAAAGAAGVVCSAGDGIEREGEDAERQVVYVVLVVAVAVQVRW